MLRFFALFLSLFFSCSSIYGEEPPLIFLKNYLGKDELKPIKEKLDAFQKTAPKVLVFIINSTSADLNETVNLAREIYTLKDKGVKIVVYIDQNALGPSALIPFLADELYGSLFIAWGDIPLSAENSMPTNILRNQVISLIPPHAPHIQELTLLAEAMSDPKLFVIDDHGWKLTNDEKDTTHTRISVLGQTLVVNQNQLKELKLIRETLPLEAFISRFEAEPKKPLEEIEQETKSQLDDQLKEHIKFRAEKYGITGENKIGRIAINDRGSSISQATWIYVKNALEYYKKVKPIFIILELNTPGGEVFAAENISDALKEMDTQHNIPIIAFIDNWAMSAGAMLAYSCRFIAVAKDATMGAAEPIIEGAQGTQTASEKINSALRADFASRAKFFGRNPYIAEAMVDKDIILVLRHGKILKLDSENQIRTQGPDPDILISPKGKLLTLNAEQLIEYGVADILLPPKQLEPISSSDWEYRKWPFKKELLSENAFFATIPDAVVDNYEMDWKTRFFALLANPLVQSALFLGMLIGFYLELNNPGLTLPAGIAITCLFLIILSSFSQEIASWLEVIFVLVGIAIILVELFVLPTFGLLGFLGIALFLIGLFSLMLPGLGSISFEYDTKTFNAAGQAFLERLSWLSATLIAGIFIMIILGRYVMPTFGGFNRFVLQGHEQNSKEGYFAGVDPRDLPKEGLTGKALTHLRPSGKVVINDKIYEALSGGRFIDKDAPVVITRIDGGVLIVHEVEKES